MFGIRRSAGARFPGGFLNGFPAGWKDAFPLIDP